MLTTAAARKAILDAMPAYEKQSVAVAASIGKVLRQGVVAERDQPPFDRVMMDGIAISYADVENNTREFPIQAMQAAGDKQIALEAGKAIEIMTGASLPIGADCIVPVERISISNDIATLEAGYEAEQNQFIHPRGSDHNKGAELLSPGKRISPMDVAIINSCGLTDVDTSKSPRIRVIRAAWMNELVLLCFIACFERRNVSAYRDSLDRHNAIGSYGQRCTCHDLDGLAGLECNLLVAGRLCRLNRKLACIVFDVCIRDGDAIHHHAVKGWLVALRYDALSQHFADGCCDGDRFYCVGRHGAQDRFTRCRRG
jgi:hypothetical protein